MARSNQLKRTADLQSRNCALNLVSMTARESACMPKLLKVTMGIAAALCLGGLVLPFASGGSVLGKTNAVHSRSYWKAKYRRPSQIPFPKSDPYSEAKANLGRMLFWDPILSGSRTRSCASCHNPGLSWGDGLPRAIGEDQKALPLRTPTLLNVAWIDQFGWTGHFQSLEDVTFGPITGAANMNLPKKIADQAAFSDSGLRSSLPARVRRRQDHAKKDRTCARHVPAHDRLHRSAVRSVDCRQ